MIEVETDITLGDCMDMTKISHDPKFIKAMLELHEKDIIEYELKMSQFRNQVEQQKSNAAQVQNNLPKCPTCGSTNIKKIPASRKMLGAIGFGLLSKTARSQWECNNCGNKW
ncbi:hypothetical protein [Frisingicoccus sp.]|uniref:hypothetical protein n=1 Tax=Frisingicoccus sp. TaxID=1918627 RepID=UPI003AB51C17